jgi:hypothetical protein
MQKNVGALDSTIRIGLGFFLLFVGFLLHPQPISYAAYAGFLALAISGFSGRCPGYTLLGISTCGDEHAH